MSGVHKFRIGDPVWAKMKGFSPWPGKVSLPPAECKRPAVKKQMHCVNFFGTNDFAWIEEVNMKDYKQFKNTFVKAKQSKAIANAVEEIEKYCQGRGETGAKVGLEEGSDEDSEEDFENLMSGAPSSTKDSTKQNNKSSSSRKREQGAIDSDSSTSGPTSSTAKKSKSGRPQLKERCKEEPSSTLGEPGELTRGRSPTPQASSGAGKKSSAAVAGLLDRPRLDRPVSPSVGMDLVTSSQILREKDIQPSKLHFGFLGLGIMGSGIVKNLLNSGHTVTVWNRTVEKVKDFLEAGAKEALTPSDVIAEADITFSCVSDPQAAKDLVFGNCGVLQEINTTKGYVEMTGMDSDTSQDIAEAISLKGGRYLEAQIQGSKTQAQDGTLVILVAGDRSLFDDCQSCFQAMGKNSFYLGEVGNSSKMNLVLQTIMGVTLAGLAEGMALADRAGLQQKDVLEVLELTGLACPTILGKGKAIIDGGFPTHQPLQHMQKDLKLSLNMGDQLEQPLPLTASANEVFKHAKRLGYGEHDVSAVYIRARF